METITLPFPSQDFADVWSEWMQYRKERKFAKYAPTGLKRTFNKLLVDSNGNEQTAIKMIENAMAMSWQGIFPLKNIPNAAGFRNTTDTAKPNSFLSTC